MAQQLIGIGSAPNDGTGDTFRDAFDKVNDNFTEVYATSNSAIQPGDDAADLGSGAATDGQVLTADGLGGAAWEAAAVTYAGAASEIHAAAVKATPVDADELGLVDSAASWVLKKLTWANLVARVKVALDYFFDGSNIAIDLTALNSLTTGTYNVGLGYFALNKNTTGVYNFAANRSALAANTTGTYNLAIGRNALAANTTASYNVGLGYGALSSNITGSYNFALGINAGRYHADGSTALTDPESSIYIGRGARGKDNADDNSVVIGGNTAIGLGANTTVIGTSATTLTRLYGDIGLGVDAPSAKVHSIKTTEQLRLGYDASNYASFTVDSAGNLALANTGTTPSVYIATLRSGMKVTAVTTTASPAATDAGTVFTNEGDADGATITLPTAAAGLNFIAYVQTAQTLTITAGSGDTIRIANNVTAAAGSISSAVVGSSVTLVAINATEWVATSSVGSWSF